MNRIVEASFIALLACFFLVGCKKQEQEEIEVVNPELASFENMKIHIFNHNCTSCHNVGATSNLQHGLPLEGAVVYEKLFNVIPHNNDAELAGLRLVVPGYPDSSFLYTKTNWNAYPNYHFGNQMPLGADLLTSNELEFIRQWIEAGAPKTGVVANPSLLNAH
jgi:hypothetical protein